MSDFRRLAEECLRLAGVATKPEDRFVLVDIAGRWLDFAARSEITASLAAKVDTMRRPATPAAVGPTRPAGRT